MGGINLKKFPYQSIRPSQELILQKLKNNWDKYRYFVIEAATGTGKSALAKTICASNEDAFLLTATKQLQDQYINDFSDNDTVSIKGRANYPCAIQPSLNVECGPCLVDKKLLKDCKSKGICHYYKTRERALLANTSLTSYQYFFYSTNCGRFWKPRDILILDECHLFEQQIVQWATLKIDPKELKSEYNIELSKLSGKSGYRSNYSWLKEVWNKIVNKRLDYLEEVKESLDGRDPDTLSEDEMDEILTTHSSYYQIDKLYKRLEVFFETKNKEDNWVVEPDGNGLILTPVDVSHLFHKYVKKWGTKKIIFMSATILDTVGFCKNLGLKKEEVGIIRVDSEFPPEKSPIIYNPCGSMNYKNLDSTMPKILTTVKEILDKHPNEKAIIHTGNYKIAEAIVDGINNPRLIMRDQGENNESLLRRHIDSDEPTVLVSPSLTTGADLKDDLSRFQIIVKLPFLSLADKRVAKKIEKDNEWYVSEMFRTFIQACGRSTRSEEDWSTTYVLDSSFYNFIYRYRKWFQKQFLKRIVWKQEK